ncbi:polysaccharide pyruvyl transferase family protein [uncultured Desulfobacter sp.]|uniref:polysaccharide pyruvyl transferase family protein n=1 Tax=uncultured Desulfobacter sp. TaxID=240139 RepID=UPI0029F47DF4|nr:polysaccharide pyruvyl transferase family protein [uncultured Desulfobacter sp.]
MKTGTITFHCSHNFGSTLQTFALQTVLVKNGIDNTVINYVYEFDMRNYSLFRKHLYLKNPKSLLADIIRFNIRRRRKKNYEAFIAKHIKMTIKEYRSCEDMRELTDQYDTFIAGSDQIWNASCTAGVVPAYFLDFVEGSGAHTVAYSPSIGHAEIQPKYQDDFKKYLKNINIISVREKSTIEEVKKLTAKPVVSVMDPTLLLCAKEYEAVMVPVDAPFKYIFYYVLEPNFEMDNYVRSLSEKYKLKVIYFSHKKTSFPHGELSIFPYGPGEFLYLIKNASYVVTNSFHASIFSVLFRKKFITYTTKLSYPRMIDFLGSLGLSERINNEAVRIQDPIDYEETELLLKIEREKSITFLITSLKREK